MDLSKILSIAGKNGLFKVITQGKNSVIVESLVDGKRSPAFGSEKISSLEEISVFTTGEDMPLKDVFKAFYKNLDGKPAIDPKSDNNTLKKFFGEMVPEYDHDRVYVSDMKKMVAWYNLLLQHEMIDLKEESETEGDATEPAATEEDAAGENVEK